MHFVSLLSCHQQTPFISQNCNIWDSMLVMFSLLMCEMFWNAPRASWIDRKTSHFTLSSPPDHMMHCVVAQFLALYAQSIKHISMYPLTNAVRNMTRKTGNYLNKISSPQNTIINQFKFRNCVFRLFIYCTRKRTISGVTRNSAQHATFHSKNVQSLS